MRNNRLIILAVITLIVVGVAGVFVKLRTPQAPPEKALLFPELASKLREVSAIDIAGQTESISLSRKGDDWVIDDFDGYPALPETVKSTVIGVSELRIVAPKTADPQLYPRLGVEDPSSPDATSLLLTLKDGDDNILAGLIVGHPRKSRAAEDKPGLYIRKPDAKQSYLVEGLLNLSAEKSRWFERTLFDIQSANISRVKIDHADGDAYSVFKSEKGRDDFELEPVPAGKQATSTIILNKFGSLLREFHSNSVHAQENISRPDSWVDARISTFEGLVVDIRAFEAEGIGYAAFNFDYDQANVAAEDPSTSEEFQALVDGLNQRLAGWIFEIPDFKYEVLSRSSASLLVDQAGGGKPEGA